MIERVNQTISVTKDNFSRAFNFPRGSTLALTYRVKPVNFEDTTGEVSGVELTFGIGNPPDFGLGNTQTETLALPGQSAGPIPFNAQLTAYAEQLTILNEQIVLFNAQIALLAASFPNLGGLFKLQEKAFLEGGGESAGYIEADNAYNAGLAEVKTIESEIKSAEGQIKATRAQITGIERERKHFESDFGAGWTPPVTASYSRAFDALRITILASDTAQFTLEYTLEVFRPEDLGPTYTQPFSSVDGG
jgi:hypothetical protein